MSIRVLCAAAAVAVGVGQAEAATYRYELTYLNTAYDGVEVSTRDLSQVLLEDGRVTSDNDIWGIPTAIPGSVVNTTVSFKLHMDGSGVRGCKLGSINCDPGKDPYWSNWQVSPIYLRNETMSLRFSEVAKVGTAVEFWDVQDYPGSYFLTSDYSIYVRNRTTRFVVSDVDMAPVPLPAAAALLPLGIGALALMRKRRRPA